jgi:ABC-type Mn2+/Zn2+ transport system permease subunit
MRGRLPRPGDRAIGIVLGIVLGIAIILIFLFLGSRSTIDEPSLSGSPAHTVTQPATTGTTSNPKPPSKVPDP